MTSAITSSTQAQPVAQSTEVSQPSPQTKSQPTTTDTVQISSAAKAALAEATETSAQTAKEARLVIFRLRSCLRKKRLQKQQKAKLLYDNWEELTGD